MAYNFSNWYQDAQLYRPVAKSLTTTLNATAFNNTGIVSGEQFNPNIMFAGTLLGMSMSVPDKFFELVKCLNTRKPLRFPKGFDVVDPPFDKFPLYIQEEIRRVTNVIGPINLDPNTSIQVVNFGDLGGSSVFPNTVP